MTAAAAAETMSRSVQFVSPMPGLAPYTAFTIEQLDGAAGLFALRAVDADVRLFLWDPRSAEYPYSPDIPADVLADIGAPDQSAAGLFVVANPSAEGVHVNLRAPIVIHDESGRAVQVILDDQAHPIRALLGS